MSLYEKIIEKSQNCKNETQALILIEYGFCCLQFFKSTKSEKSFERAKELIGLWVEMTGKMGRRTKY